MKINTKALALSLLAVGAITAASVATASAYQGDNNTQGTPPNDDVRQAIENDDYSSWKEAVDSRPKITDYINESNFDKFVEMHNLMQEGKADEANAIREELGLPDHGFGFGGPHGGMMRHGQDETSTQDSSS